MAQRDPSPTPHVSSDEENLPRAWTRAILNLSVLLPFYFACQSCLILLHLLISNKHSNVCEDENCILKGVACRLCKTRKIFQVIESSTHWVTRKNSKADTKVTKRGIVLNNAWKPIGPMFALLHVFARSDAGLNRTGLLLFTGYAIRWC